MSAGASIGNVAHLLKRVYSNREVENAVYEENPLFALMRKVGGFTGSHHIHALRHRDPQGRNPTFTSAQSLANSSAGVSKGKQFLVTRVKDYSVYTLETEAMLATRDDRGAFLRTLTDQVDGTLNQAGRSMGIKLYKDGNGEAASNIAVASTVFTVGEAVTNFEVGQVIVCAQTATGALRNSGTGCTITAVDRDAGTITVDANTDSAANGDSLFIKGDRQAGAITAWSDRLNIAGLDAWVPSTAPSPSESFFGVDRSEDPVRLAGLRLDISALTPEEGLVTALHRLAREGGKPSHIFMSFLDSKNIHLALGSKAVTEYMQVGDIGFSSIRITGPKGDVRIVPDLNAPAAKARLLTLDTWEIKHLGDLMNFIDQDGARLSRVYNDDAFEGRINFYGNVVCYAPHKNMVATLPS